VAQIHDIYDEDDDDDDDDDVSRVILQKSGDLNRFLGYGLN
jgi:hypothetical protein